MKHSYRLIFWGGLSLLLGLVLVAFAIGRYPITPQMLAEIVYAKVANVPHSYTSTVETVLFQLRLPRILVAMMVGSALCVAGICFQGVFQNPMAAPDILGASNGAAFGAALAILWRLSSGGITILAFGFSLLSIWLVFTISKFTRGKQVLSIILVGLMVSNVFSAATSFVKLVADPSDQLPAITFWLMGSLNNSDMGDVCFLAIALLVGIVPLFLLRWQMNVLTLHDDEARAIGVHTKKLQVVVILAATLLTAASVSVSGMIGWVGLLIPNLCRRVVGSDYRKLLPTSMIYGSAFLLLVDTVARTMFTSEIPLSILTAFIGAPFFLYLMTNYGGGPWGSK
ncbi:iron ABC transporter permease [Bengtsoniella intestinalis]|uniref:FecCD family ABC transporter permease n=1 Tax=Bengtsoniella intestinalis TaxID=3073143 RepID=UPI00391F9448